jgi:hypothetical protein
MVPRRWRIPRGAWKSRDQNQFASIYANLDSTVKRRALCRFGVPPMTERKLLQFKRLVDGALVPDEIRDQPRRLPRILLALNLGCACKRG